MHRAVDLVTDMPFPVSSEQGRTANRIAYMASFANAELAASAMVVIPKQPHAPQATIAAVIRG